MRFTGRMLVAGVTAAMMLTAALMGAPSPATAVTGLTGSPFDGSDGAADAGITPVADVGAGATDTSYAGGSAKEDDQCPTAGTGSIPPNKNDLTKMWFSVAKGTTGNHFLYLGWERTDDLGSATIDFELNAATGPKAACNGVNPDRQTGDRLIAFHWNGNQGTTTIELRQWDDSGSGAWGPAAVLNPGTTPSAEASVSVNRRFGEVVIDLEAAGIFSAAACTSFAGAFAKARTSSNFQSELNDYIPRQSATVTNCGSLTITKDARPDSSRDFSFALSSTLGSAGLPSSFSLDDDADATVPASRTFGDLKAGTYTVSEDAVADWALTGISCTGTATVLIGSDADAGFNDGDRQVRITFAGNGTASCTFTNTEIDPTISVTKVPAPSSVPETGGTATFTVTVTNEAAEALSLDSLVDDVFGDLDGLGTCDLSPAPALSASGGDYSCSFSGSLAGDAGGPDHENTVAAVASDADGNQATATATATVSFTDVLPTVTVAKSASPATLPAEGGPVLFTVAVSNTSAEDVDLVSLVDDPFGNLLDPANPEITSTTCTAGTIAAGATRGCTFTVLLPAVSGDHTDTVTATVADDEGNEAKATDSATVTVAKSTPRTPDPAGLAIDKTVDRASVNPGDSVTYSYLVTNPGGSPVDGLAVTDDKCSPVTFAGGDTDGDGRLDPGEAWSFNCTQVLTGAGGQITNVGTATGTDPEGRTLVATDTATVTVVAGVVFVRTPGGGTPAVPGQVAGGELPRTGSEVGAWLRLAAALIALGASLLFVSRRLRRFRPAR